MYDILEILFYMQQNAWGIANLIGIHVYEGEVYSCV